MRSLAHPDYERTHRPKELRERLSAIHRKRWGAPDGYCTIYGIHVPFEHRDPVRYWADWMAHRQGREGAQEFISGLKSEEWASVPRLRTLWVRKKQISKNSDLIRELEWEAYRANQNGG